MGNYIRNGARILYNYVLSLILFVVFVYIFITIAGNNFGNLLPLYSFIIFLFTFFIIYSETRRLALKEKKPQNGLNPYPVKGLVYGAIGFLPIAVLEVVSVFITFGSEFGNNLKNIALNTIMGPLFFIIKPLGEKPLGYAAASLIIPVVSMLGYMAGYYGFSVMKSLKKEDKKPKAKAFEKSPWNPSNKAKTSAGSKKKTNQPRKI
jgi:hypothetical protein